MNYQVSVVKKVMLFVILCGFVFGIVDAAVNNDGSWDLKCRKASNKNKCALVYVKQLNKKQAIVIKVINLPEKNKWLMHFTMPLGVYFPGGVHIQVDAGKKHVANYLDCSASSCIAILESSPWMVSMLSNGTNMKVEYSFDMGRKNAKFDVPLAGTRQGLDSISKAR